MNSVFTPVEPIPPIELAPGITMDFQVIPPVSEQEAAHEADQPLSFLMGSRGYYDDEEPRHRVIIPRPFHLGTFPVTQAQFAVWTDSADYAEWFAGAPERQEVDETTPHQNSNSGSPLLPAENLSWYEAKAFLRWLNRSGKLPAGLEARLPCEAEWEYACRAGTETEYWSGDGEAALGEVGWYDGNSESRTHPVGEKEKPNPWGLHDLHGNVWEWCEDASDSGSYAKRPSQWQASVWQAGDSPIRVLRGGSWFVSAGGCRSACRLRWHPALPHLVPGLSGLAGPPRSGGGAKRTGKPRRRPGGSGREGRPTWRPEGRSRALRAGCSEQTQKPTRVAGEIFSEIMPFHLFQYPLPGSGDLSDLNAFLAAQRVVQVQQHLVSSTTGATLVFVVQTAAAAGAGVPDAKGDKKVDYRAELSAEDFAVFSRLREERKRIAEAEGVPVYTILTNEQLAAMARQRPQTLAAMSQIEGLGPARLEKHGRRFLDLLDASPAKPSP